MRRVLAIDGGGVRGVIPAAVLAEVERGLGHPIARYFDLIVGTSTGGIIALGLGASIPAAEIRDFYVARGPAIFPARAGIRKLRRLATAKYDHEQLRTELGEVLGELRLGDSSTRLVIPSMDVNSGRVHLWKTAHNPRFVQDYLAPMIDVAMATSAAPTYFQAFLSDSGAPLIDGGVFANNPAGLAAVEAVGVMRWNPSEIRILSLGCGADALDIRTRGWWRSGIAGWAPKLSAVFMAAQSDASSGAATHLISNRDHFLRLSPTLPSGRYGLDVASELASLRAHGETLARHELQNVVPLFFEPGPVAEPFVPDHAL